MLSQTHTYSRKVIRFHIVGVVLRGTCIENSCKPGPWAAKENYGVNEYQQPATVTSYTRKHVVRSAQRYVTLGFFFLSSSMEAVASKNTRVITKGFTVFRGICTDAFGKYENKIHVSILLHNQPLFNVFQHAVQPSRIYTADTTTLGITAQQRYQ